MGAKYWMRDIDVGFANVSDFDGKVSENTVQNSSGSFSITAYLICFSCAI
jgi:hypothetical protein